MLSSLSSTIRTVLAIGLPHFPRAANASGARPGAADALWHNV